MSVVINSKEVAFQGKSYCIVRENITLPTGVTTTYDLLRHPGASAIVPMADKDTVILLRQYRHAVGDHIWEIPAGTLEPGEDPFDCAKRELTEETGFSATAWEKLGETIPVPGYSDERIHLYLAKDLSAGAQNLDAGEWLEVHPVPFSEALEMIRDGRIVDGKTITALLLVQMKRSGESA